MYWYIWWGVSMAFFLVAVVDAFIVNSMQYKRKRLFTPNRTLILGTFLSAAVLFFPIYLARLSDSYGWFEWGKAALLSMLHAIRLFAFEGDFIDFWSSEPISTMKLAEQMLYTGTGIILYTVAPMLTFGLILSFFKNFSAYRRYMLSFLMDTHVFSELNEKTLALAKSIDQKYNTVGEGKKARHKLFREALIVFTDVTEKKDEESLSLQEQAKELGAILFTKDLESIKYRNKKFSLRKLNFYLISYDEQEKLRHAESIMKEYDQEDVELRIVSDDIRSALLLATKPVENMKVVRINDIQSLIYHNLDAYGTRLFQRARAEDDSTKTISAVVVGFGRYGVEMVKALTWFCQLPGYRVKIHVFDADKNAEGKFKNMCPELMSPEINGQYIPGDAQYDIRIEGGVDINSPEFYEKLAKIKDATYIFVCLGEDSRNLAAAVKIRELTERVHYTGDHSKPDIETVIYDSNIRNKMGVKWLEEPDHINPDGARNFKSQKYDIHIIGDPEHYYCLDTLIASDIEEAGRQVHLRNGDEASFWKYEYSYRSSIAKAIHERLREKMKLEIPGIHKEWEQRTEQEKLAIGLVEHVRWNAYMRTEGYRYSGSKSLDSRNDLAKLHHNLVSVKELSDEDLRKDA